VGLHEQTGSTPDQAQREIGQRTAKHPHRSKAKPPEITHQATVLSVVIMDGQYACAAAGSGFESPKGCSRPDDQSHVRRSPRLNPQCLQMQSGWRPIGPARQLAEPMTHTLGIASSDSNPQGPEAQATTDLKPQQQSSGDGLALTALATRVLAGGPARKTTAPRATVRPAKRTRRATTR